MQMRLLTQLPGMTLAVMLMLVGAQGLRFGPEAQAEGGRGLEGPWLNAVKIVTCPPAPHVVIATFQSMTTYIRGGVLIEGGAPPFPAASRSAGHGIWERTGHHTFRVFFRIHYFDNLGRLVRITEVTTNLRLIKGDDPETPDIDEPYYLSGEGTNRITNLNPDDGSVLNVTEGATRRHCALSYSKTKSTAGRAQARQSRQSAPQHGGAWHRTAGRAVQAGRGEGRWSAALRGERSKARGVVRTIGQYPCVMGNVGYPERLGQ